MIDTCVVVGVSLCRWRGKHVDATEFVLSNMLRNRGGLPTPLSTGFFAIRSLLDGRGKVQVQMYEACLNPKRGAQFAFSEVGFMRRVQVVPVVYEAGHPWKDYKAVAGNFANLYHKASTKGIERYGDVEYLLSLSSTVFVFNDNMEAWANSEQRAGGGNAVIRPLSRTPIARLGRPLACGIPTGSNGKGFSALTPGVRSVIDRAVYDLYQQHILGGGAKRVVYCAQSEEDTTIGTGIFSVDADVLAYITEKLQSLHGLRASRKGGLNLTMDDSRGRRAVFNS